MVTFIKMWEISDFALLASQSPPIWLVRVAPPGASGLAGVSPLFFHCFPLFVSISLVKQLKICFSPIAFYCLFVLFAPVSSIQVKFFTC